MAHSPVNRAAPQRFRQPIPLGVTPRWGLARFGPYLQVKVTEDD